MRIHHDTIYAAVLIFELANDRVLSEAELEEIERHEFTGIAPSLLQKELIHLICSEDKTDADDRRSAYWALGKRFDASLIPFFRDQLRIEQQRDVDAVYQILIALDNLNEPVFGGDRGGSYSLLDKELNWIDAGRYLSTLLRSPVACIHVRC
ncbi:MAG: hypothetical protein ABIT37_00760 [Luteolibacter sp.]